ncbi:MAG: glycosyl hydrolase 53 family protein [Bacteroidales bacterium]|nr:glycosyl hydrolase 53 family protein [Bacteroidales bacterium]
MKRILSISLLFLMSFCAVAQNINLTFEGRDANKNYVQLNRVVVTNLTQGSQKIVSWPDTTLTTLKDNYYSAGVSDAETCHGASLQLSQNNPNPFNATTDVYLTVAKEGPVTLEISDMNGRVVGANNYSSLQGVNHFRVTIAQTGTYILTARQNGKISSIKMVCNEAGSSDRVEYQGVLGVTHDSPMPNPHNAGHKADIVEYVGYATINGVEVESQHIIEIEGASQTITLLFEGTPTIKGGTVALTEPFRVALSLSPFSLNQFEDGYTFVVGNRTATTPAELQQIYRDLGSTEMYVRIGTKRHKTAENTVDGKPDENANVHTFDQAIQLCQIAAELDVPINPEIMCAYTYMDMMESQGPRFEEYPEIYALQNGKAWSELSLDEICIVLEAYGEFVAESILNTGCTVNNWNLGNEANFCFAGIGIKAETAVNPRLAKASNLKRYLAPTFSVWWLKKHVWQYNAPAYAAVKRGVLSAYEKLGIDAANVKFSTHIATVVFPTKCSVKFFNYMKEKGYAMDVAGIRYYPSAPSMSANRKKLLTKTVSKINEKCGLEVFIGEFSYPSGKMEGPFAGWNKKLKGYNKNQQGQANLYSDVIAWGKSHGLAGIRYWAPDYEGWYAMSMFEFANKKGTAKVILKSHKDLLGN